MHVPPPAQACRRAVKGAALADGLSDGQKRSRTLATAQVQFVSVRAAGERRRPHELRRRASAKSS